MKYLYTQSNSNLKINENLIYDIGMHTGRDTEFYLCKGFKVVAVEANPNLVTRTRGMFRDYINNNDLIIINKAISERSGEVSFYIDKHKEDWGSLYQEWNEHEKKELSKITVETIPLDELLLRYGIPYYMKIDIEGADLICLKSLLNFEIKPTFISAELMTPQNLKNLTTCLDILSTLKVLGYNKFKLSNQSMNIKVVCPDPSLEGKLVDYKFDGESSGLFGKELPGTWIDYDFLVYNYIKYFHEYDNKVKNYFLRRANKFLKTKFKENPIFTAYNWYDIHATY